MKKLGYPAESMGWIRPYHSTISEWDKSFIVNIFAILGDKNTKYIIFLITNAYSMSIDNPDLKLIIQ